MDSELDSEIKETNREQYMSEEQKDRCLNQLITETGNTDLAKKALERMMNGNDLTSINYLSKGLDVSRSVCRILLRNDHGQTVGFGTGFLVAPGVLITNQHVIGSSKEAKNAIAQFDYEIDVHGNEKPTVSFSLNTKPTPIAIPHLDFCLVGISPTSLDNRHDLGNFGWLPLNPAPGKAVVGEYLTIIQHPGGERKQICVRENKLLRFDPQGDTLWYATDTVAGSSGSPVFNNLWQVVAIHHSGVPKTNDKGEWLTVDNKVWNSSIDESQIDWIANEGIRVSQILAYLESNFSGHPLAKAVLSNPAPPLAAASMLESKDSMSFEKTIDVVKDGVSMSIPYRISFRMGQQQQKTEDDEKDAIPDARD